MYLYYYKYFGIYLATKSIIKSTSEIVKVKYYFLSKGIAFDRREFRAGMIAALKQIAISRARVRTQIKIRKIDHTRTPDW